MADLSIDTSEITQLVNRLNAAPRVIQAGMTEAMRESTQLVTRKARQIAPKGETKNLSTNIHPEVHVRGLNVEGVVTAREHYATAIEVGRKAFGPKTKKALRFEIGGKVIFAKWVRAAPAQPFMKPALQQSEQQIRATFRVAANRAIRQALGV